jgi:hypothetical protein
MSFLILCKRLNDQLKVMDIYKPKFEKPKTPPSFRKVILRDWHECIPTLIIRKPMAISRRAGPLLISIGFDVRGDREYYMQGFCAHNLSNPLDFLAAALDTPLRTIRTNAPDFLTVRGHEKEDYLEAAERMKKQALLPLEGPISLQMIIKAYKAYVAAGNSVSIRVVQDPALIAAWAGQNELAKDALEWGYKEFATWPELSHERQGGLNMWYKAMQEKIANPEKLRQIAEEQAIFHKVDHIPMEELIID